MSRAAGAGRRKRRDGNNARRGVGRCDEGRAPQDPGVDQEAGRARGGGGGGAGRAGGEGARRARPQARGARAGVPARRAAQPAAAARRAARRHGAGAGPGWVM